MSDSLRPHGLQHARPPCPSPTPGAYQNSCPIELVMPSNHLILCHPLLLSHSIFPSIRVFSNEKCVCAYTLLWLELCHHPPPPPKIYCVLSRSVVFDFVTLWTKAHQAPLFLGFSSKNVGVGCHILLQGISTTQGTNHVSCIS